MQSDQCIAVAAAAVAAAEAAAAATAAQISQIRGLRLLCDELLGLRCAYEAAHAVRRSQTEAVTQQQRFLGNRTVATAAATGMSSPSWLRCMVASASRSVAKRNADRVVVLSLTSLVRVRNWSFRRPLLSVTCSVFQVLRAVKS
eukprot:21527-Heterococcus_DN1.PRE.1